MKTTQLAQAVALLSLLAGTGMAGTVSREVRYAGSGYSGSGYSGSGYSGSGYYGSTGGGYSGSGYYGSTGGGYSGSGYSGSISTMVSHRYDRFDTDEDVIEEYYEGWQEARHTSYSSRRTIPGAAGEEALAFTRGSLWFNWTAPKDGYASFSTRGSQSTPNWGCDTKLTVYRLVSPASLLNSGAYWYREYYDNYSNEWFSEVADYTAQTANYDWDYLYDADGNKVDRYAIPDGTSWGVEMTSNEDEEVDIYEWTSLGSFDAERGRSYVVKVDAWDPGEVRLAWHMDGNEAEVAKSVYRFYSKGYKGHFYTMDENEMWSIRQTNPNWKYEGEAYASNYDGGGRLVPLYRFYSKGYRAHFFTIDPDERDTLILTNPNWKFEGIAFYVQDGPAEDTMPVYRFWSKKYRHHFYTMDEAEMWSIRQTNPNWKYEGIAYYAVPD